RPTINANPPSFATANEVIIPTAATATALTAPCCPGVSLNKNALITITPLLTKARTTAGSRRIVARIGFAVLVVGVTGAAFGGAEFTVGFTVAPPTLKLTHVSFASWQSQNCFLLLAMTQFPSKSIHSAACWLDFLYSATPSLSPQGALHP